MVAEKRECPSQLAFVQRHQFSVFYELKLYWFNRLNIYNGIKILFYNCFGHKTLRQRAVRSFQASKIN